MGRATEAAGVLVRTVAVAVGVGALLGALTKAVIELFNGLIALLWTWLPDRLDVEPSSFGYLAVGLGVGGVLVGLGQRYLGYYPEPLETVEDDVRRGEGVDHRTMPRTLCNSVAALGFGAPLGPEAALVSVVGGVFYWTKQRMEALALRARRVLRGRPDEGAPSGWRYVPAVVAAIVLVIVFRALPGGIDLTFVPRSVDPGSPDALAAALVAGFAGGVLGLVSRAAEARMRALRLFERAPVLTGLAGGLAVAVLAAPSFLVLFSGTENMRLLFDGSQSAATLTYAATAKWLGMMVVFATGWKGGPVFPLMFVSGAFAVAAGSAVGVAPVILYAGGIAGAAAGALRSLPFGALATLLVVPAPLFLLIVAGVAGAGLVLVATSRIGPDIAAAGQRTQQA